jgi:capsular polysaccharide biosynthesis protein
LDVRPRGADKGAELLVDLIRLDFTVLLRIAANSGQLGAVSYLLRTYPDIIRFLSDKDRALLECAFSTERGHEDSLTTVQRPRIGSSYAIREIQTMTGFESPAQLQPTARSTQPAVQVLCDVEVSHGFVVSDERYCYVSDITADPRNGFVACQRDIIESVGTSEHRCAIQPAASHLPNLDSGLLLAGRADDNWYHFVIDTLPRLAFFDSAPAHTPLLVRETLPSTARDLLQRLCSRPIISLGAGTSVRVRELYVVVGASSLTDVFDPGQPLRAEFASRALLELRSRIGAAMPLAHPKGTQVVVQRKSKHRRVYGYSTIARILSAQGWWSFDPAVATFQQQYEVFSSTRHVIIPGGAAMASMLFMNPGTRVIALMPDAHPESLVWQQLAELLDLEYQELRGRVSPLKNRSQAAHPNYSAPAIRLIRAASRSQPRH